MTVGENIKRIRKDKGLTQKQLGEKCEMAESTLRQYELGLRNPKIETLKKIAAGLEVPVEELLDLKSLEKKLPETIYLQDRILEKLSSEDEISQKDLSRYVKELNFLMNQEDLIDDKIHFLREQTQLNKEYSANRNKILSLFSALNSNGQQKIIDYAEDLAKIPEYQKEPDPE